MSGLAHLLLLIADKKGERFHTIFLITDRIALENQNRLALTKYLMRNGFFDVFYAVNSYSLDQLMKKWSRKSARKCVNVLFSALFTSFKHYFPIT
uniref:AlNc14C193G8516 protein n=1 Tax=Albugo laibachii Nc14 TaxID=890382 RepID=F0WQ36_9STRA|nr:AlNc14C193G8516 [Albugo laibachii Nc14]|eukprot:CCA23441.1 AlNc14C193G8516 [Albugo laibachii Nc14]